MDNATHSDVETVKVRTSRKFTGPGRTMHEATLAGTYYLLEKNGRDVGDYPGCETIEECLRASAKDQRIQTGDVIEVSRHLPQSRIGCRWLEHVKTVRVEVLR